MKKIKFLIILSMLLSAWSVHAQLRHVPGFHAVGAKVGTGWGNTATLGLSYNYYFHKSWSVSTNADIEFGKFGTANYFGVLVSPGVEFAAWQPLKWMYLHLNAHLNVGADKWSNSDAAYNLSSFVLGGDLGFNLEMYVSQKLSVLVAARQHCLWRTNPGENQKSYYFKPLFMAGLRYNFN